MAIRYGGAEPFDSFDRGHYEKHFCEFILNWYQWFSRRCRFKIFQNELWLPYFLAGPNHLVNL